ncbi:serine hydrolase domain-containing protein [Amycolatopsis alkalitolerans]|uniref:serine hydrolase domain-containing protein n=1 Tax=Amycolatopsis alkalitolerans TaxID=2547244 RepID=UPI001359D1BB|nr:serine hydrolase domain-containing protein [Amycolatopsis alkalitolerans]
MSLETAVELVEARGAVAQLCVLRGDEVLLDRSFGCAPDALFWIFSASKPYTAILVHLLAERGQLALDAPVATYWPEFARHGKEGITVRQVLQHRSGLTTAGTALGDALAMTNWRRSVHRIERTRPRWPPGQAPAYQFLTFGFILGEVVRRVTGRAFRDVLSTELLAPLGVRDTYLGLPGELWSRAVPLLAPGPVAATLNRPAARAAVVPAAGVSTTARDLAAFYRVLLRGGDGIISASSIEQARVPSSDGELDRYVKLPIRWSQGFQLGGPRPALTPLGASSSPRTFGHNGSNCCIAWADPDRDLVYAYVTDRVRGQAAAVRHQAAVADAVLGEFTLGRERRG